MEENKKKQFLQSKKAVSLLALGIMILVFGATWAYYEATQSVSNPLFTSHSGAAIVENYDPSSSFLPGETVIKRVAFKNTGDTEIFLRVEVEPEEAWYKGNQKTELDTSMVIKNWTENVWVTSQRPNDTKAETELWSAPIKDGDKTYRYYKRILEPGDQTADILESIRLDPQVSNDRHETDYSNKTYVLTFNAEAVPIAELDQQIHLPAIWGKSVIMTENGTVNMEDGTTRIKLSWDARPFGWVSEAEADQ